VQSVKVKGGRREMVSAIKKQGFVLLRRMRDLLNEYNSNKFAQENFGRLQKLRQAVGYIDPLSYRGISRYPLGPWSPEDKDEVNELSARKKIYEFMSQSGDEWNVPEENIIATLDQARLVHHNLLISERYEIVHISLEDIETQFEPPWF
jgi:hypothetical protein